MFSYLIFPKEGEKNGDGEGGSKYLACGLNPFGQHMLFNNGLSEDKMPNVILVGESS